MLLPDGILPPCVRSGLSREVGLDGIKDSQSFGMERGEQRGQGSERVRKEEIKHMFPDLPRQQIAAYR